MLELIEQLLLWQWVNSVMDAVGFGLGAVAILVLALRVYALENRFRDLVK